MEQTEQTEKPARITSHMIAKAMGKTTTALDARIRTIKRRLPHQHWLSLEPWEERLSRKNKNSQYPSWSFSRKGARTLIRYLHLDNGEEIIEALGLEKQI